MARSLHQLCLHTCMYLGLMVIILDHTLHGMRLPAHQYGASKHVAQLKNNLFTKLQSPDSVLLIYDLVHNILGHCLTTEVRHAIRGV